jgi:arylsulfatase A-like enzyme
MQQRLQLLPCVLQKRMPSGMVGSKSDLWEGGIRNFLAVQGPGVARGVIDSTLTDVTDILPTIADIAGIDAAASTHLPWDGISLKNLLLSTAQATRLQNQAKRSSSSNVAAGRTHRGTSLANTKQLNRFLVTLSPSCWHANAVPNLDVNRWERVAIVLA